MVELHPASFGALLRSMLTEQKEHQSIFSLPKEKWYKAVKGIDHTVIFNGKKASTPLGPAFDSPWGTKRKANRESTAEDASLPRSNSQDQEDTVGCWNRSIPALLDGPTTALRLRAPLGP